MNENKYTEFVRRGKRRRFALEAYSVDTKNCFSELIHSLLSAVITMSFFRRFCFFSSREFTGKIYVKFSLHIALMCLSLCVYLSEETEENSLKKHRRIYFFLLPLFSFSFCCIHFRDLKVHLTFKYQARFQDCHG